jgi:hypothetical protein
VRQAKFLDIRVTDNRDVKASVRPFGQPTKHSADSKIITLRTHCRICAVAENLQWICDSKLSAGGIGEFCETTDFSGGGSFVNYAFL